MDPLSMLIRRAQAFRNALVQASADNSVSYGTSTRRASEEDATKHETFAEGNGLLQNLLATEGPHFARQEEREGEVKEAEAHLDIDLLTSLLDQECPVDVAEDALLQELFFPANKEVYLPSSKRKQTDSFLKRNTLCLTVNVGKLLLCQPVRNLNCKFISEIETYDLASSCLLTLIFPAITSEKLQVGSSPEQCISIMPIKANENELIFDHQSQLFWKLLSGQLLSSIWDAQQMLKVSIEVMVPDGDVLHGNAFLPLQNVVQQMFSMLQLDMVLVSSDRVSQNSCSQASNGIKQEQKLDRRSHQKREICMMPKQDSQKPLGILKVGLMLAHDMHTNDSDAIPKSMSQVREANWLYVYIHNELDVVKTNILHRKRKSFILMIKSGNNSTLRVFSMASCSTKIRFQPRAIASNFVDALLKAPDQIGKSMVFIEIWTNYNDSSELKRDGLENLSGLVKVPLPAIGDKLKSSDDSIVDGLFSLWNPRSDAEGQRLRVTVYMGTKPDMLRVLQETRSAVIIQRQGRKFLNQMHTEKLRRRQISENNGYISLQGETLRHIFEVTVQRAKNIPVEALSNNDNGYNCRSLFIKYVFPGEDDPLFTHDMELQETVVFGATAHHRITQPHGEDIVEYLENLDEETNGLRFELWTDILKKRNGTDWRLECENHVTTENDVKTFLREGESNDRLKKTEKCIGTATLPLQEILCLLKLTHQNRLSMKIRRLFDLSIKFYNWVKLQKTTSKLVVQVAYDMVELAETHLLDGTIFDGHVKAATELLLPLTSILEVTIFEVQNNESLRSLMEYGHTNIHSVRFSLFPCNRELESKYPPIMTSFDENSQGVKFALHIVMDVLIIKELWENYMTFEVWNRKTSSHDESSVLKERPFQELWVGVAIAPSVLLISQKQGIAGWIEVIGLNKQCVGCLKVSVKFSSWQSSPARPMIDGA